MRKRGEAYPGYNFITPDFNSGEKEQESRRHETYKI